MNIPLYVVDAFTENLFEGNPAAVCPLDHWLPEVVMQSIAAENNLSETAFFVPVGDAFQLRWFTPRLEVDLCGHATLAAAFVHFQEFPLVGSITFQTRSGELQVWREEHGKMRMELPSLQLNPEPLPRALEGLVGDPVEVLAGGPNLVLVFRSEAEISGFRPALEAIRQMPQLGVVVTAPGEDCDFVSRYFAPRAGIDEDPVTGSAHCLLIPYWAERLGKIQLSARQLSPRGGRLIGVHQGAKVELIGSATLYSQGTLFLP